MSWLKEKMQTRSQLKDLIEIRNFLTEHLEEFIRRKDDIPKNVFDATRFSLETLIDAYESMHALYKKRHIESCIILARTILENAVNLNYIYKQDSEKRARNFVLFPMLSWVEKSKKYEHIENPKKEELILAMKKELESYAPSGKNKNHWDGRTIKEIFEELELTSFYNEGYSRLSGFIHSRYKSGIDMHTESPYFDYIRKLIFKDTLVVTLTALKMINEKYHMLEGGVLIEDYPDKGSDLFFSVNNNNLEETKKSSTD